MARVAKKSRMNRVVHHEFRQAVESFEKVGFKREDILTNLERWLKQHVSDLMAEVRKEFESEAPVKRRRRRRKAKPAVADKKAKQMTKKRRYKKRK